MSAHSTFDRPLAGRLMRGFGRLIKVKVTFGEAMVEFERLANAAADFPGLATALEAVALVEPDPTTVARLSPV
jgi:hypothetical protein